MGAIAVTGANRGIGTGIAAALAERGFAVPCLTRSGREPAGAPHPALQPLSAEVDRNERPLFPPDSSQVDRNERSLLPPGPGAASGSCFCRIPLKSNAARPHLSRMPAPACRPLRERERRRRRGPSRKRRRWFRSWPLPACIPHKRGI